MPPLSTRVIHSALWGAYGDALGFMSELATDPNVVKARTGTRLIEQTMPWVRRIGGKFGVECKLPAGCYSDDTQLRLATCRSIRSNGTFDVDAFAKIELPVWTCYALGAGRGSKAAAASLSRDGVTWYSNFYHSEGANYLEGGGNGAAMRIQPHVWTMKKSGSRELLRDITKNAICTHGHPRGILGAAFHGLCLEHVLSFGFMPGPEEWRHFVSKLSAVPELMDEDPDIRMFWLPVWTKKCGATFREACFEVQNEFKQDIAALCSIQDDEPSTQYRSAIRCLDAMNERERGSATKTALIAAFLCYTSGDHDPESALIMAANVLGSDTDSIASMAGTMLGCIANGPPPGALMDAEYLTTQALRMARIAEEQFVEHIPYPDLMQWSPPRTQQDCVILVDGIMEVLGLGKVVEQRESFSQPRSEAAIWQWLALASGQTILAKRRKHPQTRNQLNAPTPKEETRKANQPSEAQLSFFADQQEEPGIDELTKRAIASGFEPVLIGEQIVMLAGSKGGIEKAIAYAAIIAKAVVARSKSGETRTSNLGNPRKQRSST